jgi:hypothetical protein
MITHEQLGIYEKYRADVDWLQRMAKDDEKRAMANGAWSVIDELHHNLFIVQSGLATAEFEARVRERLMGACEDESVCERLSLVAKPKA